MEQKRERLWMSQAQEKGEEDVNTFKFIHPQLG